jgi:hypothetical protein
MVFALGGSERIFTRKAVIRRSRKTVLPNNPGVFAARKLHAFYFQGTSKNFSF